MVVAIRGDSARNAEALLLVGLYVDTTYGHDISAAGYEVAEESTPLHLAAAFNASKCAKVRRRIRISEGDTQNAMLAWNASSCLSVFRCF